MPDSVAYQSRPLIIKEQPWGEGFPFQEGYNQHF